MIGIGIDTGGTCTDAVIYDTEQHQILAYAKDLTTKNDLKIGITKALQKLPKDKLKECSQIALSTTLATNACVENIGGRGKLIFIGMYEDILKEKYKEYGFSSLDDVYLLECKITASKEDAEQPDWEKFRQDMLRFLKECDCVSVVQLFSQTYFGEYEIKAADIIREIYNIPVVLGKDLFLDLNVIRRGAGALLNARLVPIIYDFIHAIQDVFLSLNMRIPIVIIRSDGSQMSDSYALTHPVETILSGPAASVVGGMTLTEEKDGLIVDMGGTTTDVAIIKNHIAKKVDSGIQIGNWKTFVKGVYIDTFGLGGDTAVHFDSKGNVYLENYRVIPLCRLAADYPSVLKELEVMAHRCFQDKNFQYEFLCLLRDIEEEEAYMPKEKKLCAFLKETPLSMDSLEEQMHIEYYTLKQMIKKLEKEGIIIRSGFTPTDAMHIKGDYMDFSVDGARYAATILSRFSGVNDIEILADTVYELVEKRLYDNVARILLTTECNKLNNKKIDESMMDLIHYSYNLAKAREEKEISLLSAPLIRLNTKLIGVGAPVHIFLPRVAELFGTKAVLPECASVANAIGAIAGKIIVTSDILLECRKSEGGSGFDVATLSEKRFFEDYEEARAFAKEAGKIQVLQKAKEQGAGHVTIQCEEIRDEVKTGSGVIWVSDTYRFTAIGSPVL